MLLVLDRSRRTRLHHLLDLDAVFEEHTEDRREHAGTTARTETDATTTRQLDHRHLLVLIGFGVFLDHGREAEVVTNHEARVQARKVEDTHGALVVPPHGLNHRRPLVGLAPGLGWGVDDQPLTKRLGHNQTPRQDRLPPLDGVHRRHRRQPRHGHDLLRLLHPLQDDEHQPRVLHAIVGHAAQLLGITRPESPHHVLVRHVALGLAHPLGKRRQRVTRPLLVEFAGEHVPVDRQQAFQVVVVDLVEAKRVRVHLLEQGSWGTAEPRHAGDRLETIEQARTLKEKLHVKPENVPPRQERRLPCRHVLDQRLDQVSLVLLDHHLVVRRRVQRQGVTGQQHVFGCRRRPAAQAQARHPDLVFFIVETVRLEVKRHDRQVRVGSGLFGRDRRHVQHVTHVLLVTSRPSVPDEPGRPASHPREAPHPRSGRQDEVRVEAVVVYV